MEMETDHGIEKTKPGHSVLGITSALIALVAFVFLIAILLVSAMTEAMRPGAIDYEPFAMLLGIVVIAVIFGCIAGIGLGVAGLRQKDRDTTFAIVGLIVNALLLIGMGLLMVVGS